MLRSFLHRCMQCLGALFIVFCYLALRHHRVVTAYEPPIPTGEGLIVQTSAPDINKKRPAPYAENAQHQHVTFFVPKDTTSGHVIPRTGVLTLRKNPKGTIVLCHGYLCNKTDIAFLRTLFPDYNCLVFDFRAHGDLRANQWCTLGKHEAYDVIAAAQALRTYPATKDTKLFGYGFSMGAVSLIEAQSKTGVFEALILDCPFDSSHTVLDRVLSNLKLDVLGWSFEMPGRTLMQRYAFHPYIEPLLRSLIKAIAYSEPVDVNTQLSSVVPVKSIQNVTVPCYFIHCKDDEKISTDAARKLYENVGIAHRDNCTESGCSFKRLWLTGGRRHFDSYFAQPEKYTHRVNKFLTQVLNGEIAQCDREKIFEDKEL